MRLFAERYLSVILARVPSRAEFNPLFYGCALMLGCSLVLGGATRSGFPGDLILALLAIPLLALAVSYDENRNTKYLEGAKGILEGLHELQMENGAFPIWIGPFSGAPCSCGVRIGVPDLDVRTGSAMAPRS